MPQGANLAALNAARKARSTCRYGHALTEHKGQRRCKICSRLKASAWKRRNPEAQREHERRYRQRRALRVEREPNEDTRTA